MDLAARRVLVCLRYGIGDVVMELPVLRALRRALPAARITALGAEPATELLEGHAALDELVSLNRWGIRHRWDRGGPESRERIERWLDEQRFDLFLDVRHVTPVVGDVVWGRGIRSLEADEDAEQECLRRGGSGVAAIREAVRAGWGVEVPEHALPQLHVPRTRRGFAQRFLQERGLGDAAPVAVSPVASSPLKRWPVQRLARVADRAVERTNRPVLAFCGPQEEQADALQRHMRYPDHLIRVGPLHLLQVAALLERCRALVCNDTGLMHLAAALRVPTLAIFGPTAPSVYRPPGEWVHAVGGEAVQCPHRRTESLHPPECFHAGTCLIAESGCVGQTDPEEVLSALSMLLERTDAPSAPAPSAA